MCEYTICSNILTQMQVSEMGLKLQGSERLPFLKTGTITADFQILGKVPWFKEAWKITVRTGAISLATSYKKRTGRLSGLVAL